MVLIQANRGGEGADNGGEAVDRVSKAGDVHRRNLRYLWILTKLLAVLVENAYGF